MRELDSAKSVRHNQTRDIAKQKQLIERLAESEKSLNMQLVSTSTFMKPGLTRIGLGTTGKGEPVAGKGHL
jgi:hypothetical protein